jgi:DNA segregation ATPase FtsK/SpoIIIE, S-DNA-T family
MTAVEPSVSLVKPPADTSAGDGWWDDDQPGDELVLRPDDDVELYRAGELVPVTRRVQTLVVRARQATARAAIVVVDQPVVAKGLAVTRQAPRAGGRLLVWTPRGAGRAAVLVYGWATDSRSSTLLAKHADAGEGEAYARVADARLKANLAGRRTTLAVIAGLVVLLALAWWMPAGFAGVLAGLALVAGLALAVQHRGKELLWGLAGAVGLAALAWYQGPTLAELVPEPPAWFWWLAGSALVVWFGLLGRQENQKLVEMPATMASTKPPPVTAPMVIAALCALGNSKMKEPDSVRVLLDPHQAGDGYLVDLELPPGVPASYVVENRENFAAAMRRALGTVWPRVGTAHPGHLSVYISNTPVNETEQEPWPLLNSGPIDIFQPQPVFTDQLGNWVYLTLAYASWVIGAVPRMGKTFLVRQLLLTYGMDPRVKVIGLDGKGTGDLSPIVPFAHLHIRGARVDKPESIEKVRELVRWLLQEVGRRADVLASLPAEEVPESKITSELIDAHPELDLGPVVAGIDETQSFFSYGFRANKEHKQIREEIRDGVIELGRLGPAVGVWVIDATQTVRDSTIPSELSAVAVYRFGLKMEGWEPNDRVLGTGAYRSGVDATMFGFDEKGIGWFKGEGAKPFIARSAFGLDAVQSRTIAMRIRGWRAAKGLLTGEAADDGIEDAEIVHSIAEDTLRVMRDHSNTSTAHLEELVAWLGELRPDYANLDVAELGKRLRNDRMKVTPVWRVDRTKQGIDLRKQSLDES